MNQRTHLPNMFSLFFVERRIAVLWLGGPCR